MPEGTIASEFRPLVAELLARNAPGSEVTVVKDLVGGRSAASVFLVDIEAAGAGSIGGDSTPLSGQFILKLDRQRVWNESEPEPDESARHKAAWELNTAFSAEHIPQLLDHVEHDHKHALLYHIAGHSLVNLVTADSLDAGTLKDSSSELIRALLAEWNHDHSVIS